MFHFPSFTLKMLQSGLLERYDVGSVKKVYIGGSCLPSTVGAEILAKLDLDILRYGTVCDVLYIMTTFEGSLPRFVFL